MAKLYYYNGEKDILIKEMLATGVVDVYRFFDLYGEEEIMEQVYNLPNHVGSMIGCIGLFSVALD